MLISLQESEIAELPSVYQLDPAPVVQPTWERRQFVSTGRYYHCTVGDDGSITIKQLQEGAEYRGQTPLWL